MIGITFLGKKFGYYCEENRKVRILIIIIRILIEEKKHKFKSKLPKREYNYPCLGLFSIKMIWLRYSHRSAERISTSAVHIVSQCPDVVKVSEYFLERL